ncbi:hypothetical protein EBR66_06535 [bacterium]|nr:hypothetical protein [bacterium]
MTTIIDIESYHPRDIDMSPQACKARRTSDEHVNRHFQPFIYSAFQCAGFAVVEGNGLCATCCRREWKESDWHGRVDESLDLMPESSHIVGGPWFTKRLLAGSFKFFSDGRPMTAKQEGHLPKAPIVPKSELMRFARGECDLDIETLSQRRQISKDGLFSILEVIAPDESVKITSRDVETKASLCVTIRRITRGPVQIFNPEEEEEVEVVGPQRASPRKYIADWSLVPLNAPLRWTTKIGDSLLTANGMYSGNVCSMDGRTWKNVNAWLAHEFAEFQRDGRIPADKKPPNPWKSVEFARDGVWTKLNTIRSIV